MRKLVGLNFHGVGTPRRDLEDNEELYWLDEADFLRALDQLSYKNPKHFVLTFDDGNASDYDIALPALLERGLHATFFILTGRIGQPGSLNAKQIVALHEHGMGIGSHGITHTAWTALSCAALENELIQSKAALERLISASVVSAGIPFGLYNRTVLTGLRKAGYTAAYSSDGGTMCCDRFLRPRTSLKNTMNNDDMESIMSGDLSLSRQLRRAAGMAARYWLKY